MKEIEFKINLLKELLSEIKNAEILQSIETLKKNKEFSTANLLFFLLGLKSDFLFLNIFFSDEDFDNINLN